MVSGASTRNAPVSVEGAATGRKRRESAYPLERCTPYGGGGPSAATESRLAPTPRRSRALRASHAVVRSRASLMWISSRRLPKGERINASRHGKGERGIWQRRYWEHTLRDEEDFAATWIISLQPVKHGMSRAHRSGLIPVFIDTFRAVSCLPIGAPLPYPSMTAISENPGRLG